MKFTKSLLLCIATVVVISLTGCGKKEPIKTYDDLLKELRDVTVMINAGEDHASGVVIGNDGDTITIVTAAHLMEGFNQGIITFYDGKAGFADVVLCDTVTDICLLTMKCGDFADGYAESVKCAVVADGKYASLNKSDKVILLGSAIGVAVNATEGTVADTDYYVLDFDQHMLYLYADVMPGMSGSGCYTSDGYLIGILSGGSDNSEAVCIKIDNVINEWRKIK